MRMSILILLVACCMTAFESAGSSQPVVAKADMMVSKLNEFVRPRYLDPQRAGDSVSSRHCGLLYETLYEYGPFDTSTLRPNLAASMPSVSKDRLTYTIKLRDDVCFAPDQCFDPAAKGQVYHAANKFKATKGPLMTADDVVYSIKRLACLYYGGYWAIEGKIAGLEKLRSKALLKFDEDTEYSAKFSEFLKSNSVAGLKAIDKHTVQIKLSGTPFPQLFQVLTLSYGSVVPHVAVEFYGRYFNERGVGTGPFVQDEISDSKLIYKRNPEYRNVTLNDVPDGHSLKPYQGKRLPLCDRIEYSINKSDEVSWKTFLEGSIDVTGIGAAHFDEAIEVAPAEIGKPELPRLTKLLSEKGVTLTTWNEPTVHYISFNMADPVVGSSAGAKGKAIRKALALAFDREKYIKEHLNQRGTAATGIAPSGTSGFFESFQSGQKFDLTAAKKVLSDAGFRLEGDKDIKCIDPKSKKQITVQVLYRSTAIEMANKAKSFVKMAGKVGIKIEPELMTFPEFLRRQDGGEGQAYDAGWVMDYPDAQNMYQLLYGPYKPRGINNAAFDNAEFNRLYEEMAVLDDLIPDEHTKKLELIRKMADILNEEMPWICIEYRKVFQLRQKGVARPTPSAFRYNGMKYGGVQR
ncbi:ABC transporter substrate-binding protein [Planctomycetota bacterium]|nr:ABC transporter substrate-binding protein [Planctomycetota bacterium]